MPKTTTRFGVLQSALLAMIILAVAGPGALHTQEIPDPDRDRLAVYARAFSQIVDVRERGQTEIARVHDTEGRERVREEIDREVEEALEAHGISIQEYEELTFLVSTNSDYEQVFREILSGTSDDP
jgi:protein-tyrosine-phosphatase